MQRLEIKSYQEFKEKEKNILWILKHHLINKLKTTEHVEFASMPSHTKRFKVEVYDEVYRTVIGRMTTDDLLYRVIKTFKRELKSYDENEVIKIKDISITAEDINDLAGDKYIITFEVANQF